MRVSYHSSMVRVGSWVLVLFLALLATPAFAAQTPTGTQATDCPPEDLLGGAVPSAVRSFGSDVRDIVNHAVVNGGPCGFAFGSVPVPAARQIDTWGGRDARVTTLPVLLEMKDGTKAQVPVYRVERRDGHVSFVDHLGRFYRDWEHWKETARLPEGKMTYPKDGRLKRGGACEAELVTGPTPASDSWWDTAKKYVDGAAAVGGVVVGVAAVVGTGGLAIPIAGAALSLYGLYRSGDTLHDLASHRQTLNPLESAEARGAWIGAGTSVLGLGAMGATARAGTILASQGAQAGLGAARVASHLQVASQVANTAGIADLGYNLTTNWNQLSRQERAMAIGQIVFWAGMTAHSARRAGGITKLYDASAIRESMIQSFAPDAVKLPDAVYDDLRAALRKIGVEAKTPEDIRRVMRMETAIPDSAVERLRLQVLSDPRYAGEVGEVLRHYTAEALAKGADTPEGRLLRLEMLMLAVPEKTRPALMEAVRIDMAAHSDRIKAQLARPGQPAPKVKRVIIGGGSQGATVANELNRIGQGDGTLIVDASRAGDQNFGSIRNFRLNSETREYQGRVGGNADGRTDNPLHGGPIQIEDLVPPTPGNTFPDAGSFGDAQVLALEAARRGGTDLMTQSKVTNVRNADPGSPGRYLVTIEDVVPGRAGRTYQVYADQVVDATGLGKPSIPLRDQNTIQFIDRQTTRLATEGGRALGTQQVLHGEDLLRAYTTASPSERAQFLTNADGNVVIIGGGDAAKTAGELLQQIARNEGTTVGNMLGSEKVKWIGIDPEKDFWVRYAGLKELFDSGTATQMTGRVEKVEPIAGTTRTRITMKMPDGTYRTEEAGRVILAMGMRSESPGVFNDFNLKERVPVLGTDPVFGNDSPLATRLPDQDIYFVGIASGLERAPKHSFLEFYGWKNLLVADQVLADGQPVPSPFGGARVPASPRSVPRQPAARAP